MDKQQPKKESMVYSRQQYATKEFWDSRYREKESYFDWYAQFPELKQTFEKEYSLTPDNSILMLGCGNSKLSEQMYEAGYHHILNIDISPTVIAQMKKISQQKGYTQMKWLEMDATDMKGIEDASYDVVIDKGTLDALISGHNMGICQKMLRQSMRVLKRDGQFILITYGSPEGRKKFFQDSIGLTNYDYYFTRVDLSSMSTLINLMRSNLGNKPLNSITKDAEAMRKSLMEFNLIKVLRRNRKNQKKYVIWSDFFSKGEQEEGIFETSNQKIQQPLTKEESKVEEKQQKVIYNPKKQSFCYVYSIKQKFANNLTLLLKEHPSPTLLDPQPGSPVHIPGDVSLQPIAICTGPSTEALSRAVKYLQLSKIASNPIVVYHSQQQLGKSKQEVKLNVRDGDKCAIPALSKAVYRIQLRNQHRTDIKQLENLMEQICRQLVEKGGLTAHPDPRNYAYLGILFQKLQLKQHYNKFLTTHWYPTYRLLSYSNQTAVFEIAVSPSLDPTFCTTIIQQTLETHKYKPTIQNRTKGYLHCYDPKVIALINFCCITYCNGQNAHLIVEEFGDEQTQKYNSDVPAVYLPKQMMTVMLARLLSAI